MKKVKEIKKVQRDQQLKDIRQYGDSERLPGNRIFKDRKKDQRKYASRQPVRDDD